MCEFCHGRRMIDVPDVVELSIEAVDYLDLRVPPPEIKTHKEPCPICLRNFISRLTEEGICDGT